MGIRVFIRDGQIQVDLPWSVNAIPDPAKATLGALRERKAELLAHFALAENPPDIRLLVSALEAQGVRLAPDPKTGFKIYITRDAPNRCNGTAIKLLNKLNDHRSLATAYLAANSPGPG